MSATEPIRTFAAVPSPAPGLPSILDDLRSELADEAEEHHVTLEVPGRPGWAVRYSSDVDYSMLKMWAKQATSKVDGTDELQFSALVLASQCRAIVRHGVDLVEGNDVLVFASPHFMSLVNVVSSTEAVKRLYGRDAHVISSANAVLAEAGYGEDVGRQDPTVR
jgi:hypothetical protein